MKVQLAAFLAGREPSAEEDTSWWNGQLPLHLRTYITQDHPPDAFITSAKAVVFSGQSVLVLRNPGGVHILPGGRREEGERPEQTVRREVHEETGVEIGALSRLGVLVYRHVNPKPVGYAYPYPEFVNVIYVAHALDALQSSRVQDVDEYEIEAAFRPVSQVRTFDLPLHQRLLLREAILLAHA